MPYSADLRCSYANTKINIDWFYESMDECKKDIDYIASKRITGTEKECEQYSRNEFENYVEYLLNYYISAKVFHFTPTFHTGNDSYTDITVTNSYVERYDNIWEFIHDNIERYKYYDTEVVIKSREEEEEEEEKEEEKECTCPCCPLDKYGLQAHLIITLPKDFSDVSKIIKGDLSVDIKQHILNMIIWAANTVELKKGECTNSDDPGHWHIKRLTKQKFLFDYDYTKFKKSK